MSRLTANSLGRDYTLGDITAEEKGLRELVELYGERLTDPDWRYQEFRCKHPVRHDPGACRAFTLMHDHLQDRPDQAAIRQLAKSASPALAATRYTGISANETPRAKPARDAWLTNRYPLIDMAWAGSTQTA